MRVLRLLVVLVLALLLLTHASAGLATPDPAPAHPAAPAAPPASLAPAPPDFVPTDEWQEVLEGQAIPPGLHVRMDVYKGGKWAKNLDPAEAGSGSAGAVLPASGAAPAAAARAQPGAAVALVSSEGEVSVVAEGAPPPPPPPPPAAGAPPADEPAEVTAALAGLEPADAAKSRILLGLPEPEPSLAEAVAAHMPPAKLAALLERVWSTRQEQVRSAWASFKTEGQQMAGLVGGLLAAEAGREPPLTPEQLLERLEDLEYHVAQVHNAEDFAAMGGLAHMARLLNASQPGVAARAAWVIGSAVKGQPTLIDVALADGAGVALQGLLQGLLGGGGGGGGAASSSSSATTASLKTLAKGLYAAGALTRYHSAGQAQFAALGGGRVLAQALDLSLGLLAGGSSAELEEAARSVAVKALHLLADLALATEGVLPKDAQAPTNAMLRFRLEAAGGNESEGGAAGGSSGAAPKVKVVLLEKAGAVEVGEGEGGGEEGALVRSGSSSNTWLEALQRDGATVALCTSARAALKVLSEHVTQEEVGRVLLPCGGA